MNIIFIRKSLISKPVETKDLKKRALESYWARVAAKFAAKYFYGLENTEIIEEKKPHFASKGVYFSISHSHDIIAVALDTEDIGFDIELLQDKNFEKISKRMGWNNVSTKQEFFKAWTQYEAQIKQKSDNVQTFLFEDYMFSVSSAVQADIKNTLKMYEYTPENSKIKQVEYKHYSI